MARGPNVNKEIERTIMEIVSHNPEIQAPQIENILIKQFSNSEITIPSLRAIQQRVKRIRDNWTIQDKPWSVAIMMQDEEQSIPWEAVEFIMKSYLEIQNMINVEGFTLNQIWKYRSDYICDEVNSFDDIEKVYNSRNIEADPQTPIMTYRQAKWLWRIHLMLPGLKPRDLFRHVDDYVQQELLSDFYGWKIDTSNLDSGIMTILRSVLTHGYYADRGDTDEGTH